LLGRFLSRVISLAMDAESLFTTKRRRHQDRKKIPAHNGGPSAYPDIACLAVRTGRRRIPFSADTRGA
jgi:hypothetical protein